MKTLIHLIIAILGLSLYVGAGAGNDQSIIARSERQEKKLDQVQNIFELYQPNYILPFYYTQHPYQQIYQGITPNNQRLLSSEFNAQFSLKVPAFINLLDNPNLAIDIAYTQLMFWQFYAKSQYFRETNYEPEIYFENHFRDNALFRLGLNHQSNGRGGTLERSWNRFMASLQLSGESWLVTINGWGLIFKSQSSALHNPRIAHFLGHERIIISKRIQALILSLEAQNIESGLKRGHTAATLSIPLNHWLKLYGRYFNGYGQSLIEYNHRTQAVAIGFAFNDWINR